MIRQSLVKYGAPLEETRAEPPALGGTEVLLRVRHCGVCHSDLHLQDGHFDLGGGERLSIESGRTLPFTLGHEISGFVEDAGPDAGPLPPDVPFAVYAWGGCGVCTMCRHGREQLCDKPRQLGIQADGGFASHVVVPHPRYLIDVSGIDALQAGSLMCSGLTAYGAIRKALPFLDGRPIGIVGLGGVGLMGLEIARALAGVPIAAADTAAGKRAEALSRGAAMAVDPAEPGARKSVYKTLGAAGAVVDFAGSGKSLFFAQSIAGKGATVVVVGLMGGRFEFPVPMFPLRALSIQGSYVGTVDEARELVTLARDGRIRPIPVTELPLARANEALERLRDGRVVGRLTLTP